MTDAGSDEHVTATGQSVTLVSASTQTSKDKLPDVPMENPSLEFTPNLQRRTTLQPTKRMKIESQRSTIIRYKIV